MGFDKIVLSRIDYKEKEIRKLNKTMEFIWKPFSQIDNSANEIFTHVQFDSYCLPNSLYFLINDIEYNKTETEMAELAQEFYETLKNISKAYNHNQVLLTYGCDFSYRNKSYNFRNIEKIMDYFKNSKKFKDMLLIYSTPSAYFKAIKSKQNTWPVYKDQDFFPYAENPFSYWTGYFSSRPYLKGIVRDAGNFLLSSSNLLSELLVKDKIKKSITGNNKLFYHTIFKKKIDDILNLRKNLAICQHHDAVAGTAKEYVSTNYIDILSSSIEKIRLTLNQILDKIIEFPAQEITNCITAVSYMNCKNLVFKLNEKLTTMLIFANNRNGLFPVSFKSESSNLIIYNQNMNIIESDIICDENLNSDNCEVYFEQEFSSEYIFNVIVVEKIDKLRHIKPSMNEENNKFLFKNNDLIVEFQNGNLNIQLPKYNQVYNITLSHSTYFGKANEEYSLMRPSGTNPDGAYVFAPRNSFPDQDQLDLSKTIFWNGTTINQLSLRFKNSDMKLRIYRSINYSIEVESIFDPVNNSTNNLVKEGLNKVLHLQSNVNNSVIIKNISLNSKSIRKSIFDNICVAQPEFWTDSNGMKMMRRYKDFRGGWDYYVTDPISSNFYPVDYAISIREKSYEKYNENDYNSLREEDRMITVFTERSQSGGVMKQGEIMLLMNRFSKSDDWKGVGENLYEKISEDTHFQMVNWISFSSNFNKRKIHDHIHKRSTIFSFGLSSNYHNFFLKEVIKENFKSESFINKIISYEDCIVVNYHVISSKQFFVQAYNNNDPYFNLKDSCKFIFKSMPSIDYTFEEINLSGVKKVNLNDELNKLKINNIRKAKSEVNNEFILNPQDIKLFSVEFN